MDPLSFKKTGYPHRTSRDRARAHGTKVGPLPQVVGYCPTHGMPHPGACNTAAPDAAATAVSESGGSATRTPNISPFKLGG